LFFGVPFSLLYGTFWRCLLGASGAIWAYRRGIYGRGGQTGSGRNGAPQEKRKINLVKGLDKHKFI
jgi:predicted XRE-type DNA-binding protein